MAKRLTGNIWTASELHKRCEEVLDERKTLEVASEDEEVEFEAFIEHDFTDHD